MKKTNTLFFLVSLFTLLSMELIGQTSGDYRSVASGNWSAAATWETYNGSAWIAASTFPTSSDGVITVKNTHTVSIDTSISVDQVTVEAGGNVTVTVGRTLTVANGADSVDMIVNGTVSNFGVITTTGRLSFESAATYFHLVPAGGGVVPTSTWRDGSTCEVDSAGNGSTTAPTNITGQSLYNFVWNSPRQGGNIGLNFPDNYVFRGNVTVTNTGASTFAWRFTNLNTGQTKTINVLGNVNVNGPNALITSTGSTSDTAAKAIINVSGDINISDGVFNIVGASNPYGEWRVKGSIHMTGGTLTGSGTGAWRRIITFVKSGTQSFSKTGGTIAVPITYRLANASSEVNLLFPLNVDGVLDLSGGKLVTTSTNIVTVLAAGNVTGGSDSSFVSGPLIQTVASASPVVKTFPIGKGSAYRPVVLSLTMDAGTATTFSAEVFNSAPPVRTLPSALNAVSSVRYYTISKGAGANVVSANAQLSYGADDAVSNKDSLRMAKDDGAGAWVNLGGSGTTDVAGTITSNVFTTFSDFVLAHVAPTFVVQLPTLLTTPIDTTVISTTTATGGGNITNDGGGAVSARGVCWNTSGSPTTSDPKTTNGNGTGAFSSSLSGLTLATKYYVRAYATNSAGTAYGSEVSFTTIAALVVPTVTTTNVSNIISTTATGGGNVSAWGGTLVTERGVCWSTSHTPTIANDKNNNGSGLGSYSVAIGGLKLGTTYYVRAYAINTTGAGYGSEVSFSTPAPQPDSTRIVAKDGSGNYTTVQAAFNAVPSNYTGKWTIFVKKGKYYEKLLLASTKINVNLIGENRDSTVLWYDDYADRLGSGNPGTSGSYSVGIDANDFTAMNITFQNTISPNMVATAGTQAVALRANGDRQAYYNCTMLGFQDTYYTYGGSATGRLYHKNCTIVGSVDFIFGRDVALFDSCTLRENRNSGTLTAGATDATSKFGYVFRDCKIVTDSVGYDGAVISNFYLGRPWQASPRTVFMNCSEPSNLSAAGWLAFNVTPAVYAEYKCTGSGFVTGSRVVWSTQLTDSAAATYTLDNILSKSAASGLAGNWTPAPPSIPTAVGPVISHPLPTTFNLEQNYPNPFNPSATISYALPLAGYVTLKIFDVLGREITTLVNEFKPAGEYHSTFSADRYSLSSGVYFYRLQSGDFSQTRKMLLTK